MKSRDPNCVCIRCGSNRLKHIGTSYTLCDECGVAVVVTPQYAEYGLPSDMVENYQRIKVPNGTLLVLRSEPEP